MARQGRPPQPGSRHSKAGRYRTIPRPSGPMTFMPTAAVQAQPMAMAYWAEHADTLARDGRLNAANVEPFATLCCYHAEMLEHQAALATEGAIIQNFRGQPMANPRVQILLRVRRDFVNLARDFGFTPASYAKLPLTGKPQDEEKQREEALLRKFTG